MKNEMQMLHRQDAIGTAYVSTGTLPPSELVANLVAEAHKRFRSNAEGRNSDVYPALARVPSELFGVCVVATDGRIAGSGDTDYEFAVMSVSKPFVFALVCQEIGPTEAREKLGANSTGLPFNSLAAIERSADGRTNPMVNAGAIVTTSLVPAVAGARWRFIHEGLSRFAGRTLPLNEQVYASASETNFKNRSIATLLQSCNRIIAIRRKRPTCTPGSALSTSAPKTWRSWVPLSPMAASIRSPRSGSLTQRSATTRWPSWQPQGCMRPPAIGSTTSACRAKAASAVGS